MREINAVYQPPVSLVLNEIRAKLDAVVSGRRDHAS
jgi:hypothetical protein